VARQLISPRKQRTRQHVIADQSVNHVERFIIDAGHTAQRFDHDYGYDLLMITYDEKGYVEPGSVSLQLKATEGLAASGADYVFDLDVRDYNLWSLENLPVILILFDAGRRKAYWLHVQPYFHEEPAPRPKKGAKTMRVHVSARQIVTRSAVARWRLIKNALFTQAEGQVP
jgi:Domain of unknown function (DUF4365)